ncbi:MAG: MEDS domain-containing protein [Gemmatimonadales bacterium]
MPSWMELLEHAEPKEHLVQLYGGDDDFLAANVGRYFRAGLSRGDGLLLIATAEHTDSIMRQLQGELDLVEDAIGSGRFVTMDARSTLDLLMEDGQPDRRAFESEIGDALRKVQASATTGRVRAFGELVGLLWSAGQTGAATRIEAFWNEALDGNAFSLYCAYPIDVSGQELEEGALNLVLGAHTHMLTGYRTMVSRHTRP